MGRKRKIPIDPVISEENEKIKKNEEIKRKPRNKKKEERLYIGRQNRWKIKEKMALLNAVREYGVDFCPAMVDAVQTKTKHEIIHFLKVYRQRANALQTPKSEAQSPFDPWMRVMENILSPLKDQSKMYIELLSKLEEQTPATQPNVFPLVPNYKRIYAFLKRILLGKLPEPLPPLESSIVLDLLRHLANLVKSCDMSVQRCYMAAQYPNLVVDPIGTAAKKQDNAILDILGYGPKKTCTDNRQENQNLAQASNYFLSRPVKAVKKSRTAHLLYHSKAIPHSIKKTTSLRATLRTKVDESIPPEAILMDIKMIKKPSGQIDYVLPEQFPVTKESLKILQNFASQSFLSSHNSSQSNYRILKIASYKTPASETLPLSNASNNSATAQTLSCSDNRAKVMSVGINQSNETSGIKSISTAKMLSKPAEDNLPTSDVSSTSITKTTSKTSSATHTSTAKTANKSTTCCLSTSSAAPISTAKTNKPTSSLSTSSVSPVFKDKTTSKPLLISQSTSPVSKGKKLSKPPVILHSQSTSHIISVATDRSVSKPSKGVSDQLASSMPTGKINRATQSQANLGVSISKSETSSNITSNVSPVSMGLPGKAVSFILPVSDGTTSSKTAVISPIPCGTYIIKLASSGTTVRKVSSVVTSVPSDTSTGKAVTIPSHDKSENKITTPSGDISVSKSSVLKLGDAPENTKLTKASKIITAPSSDISKRKSSSVVESSNDTPVVPSVLCGSSISKAISELLSQSTCALSSTCLTSSSIEDPGLACNSSTIEPSLTRNKPSSVQSSVVNATSLNKMTSVSFKPTTGASNNMPLNKSMSFPASILKSESSLKTCLVDPINQPESKDSITILCSNVSDCNELLKTSWIDLASSKNTSETKDLIVLRPLERATISKSEISLKTCLVDQNQSESKDSITILPSNDSDCNDSLKKSLIDLASSKNTLENKESIVLHPVKPLESSLVKLPSSGDLTVISAATLAQPSNDAPVQPSNDAPVQPSDDALPLNNLSVAPTFVSLSTESHTITPNAQLSANSTSLPSETQSSTENEVQPEDPEYVRLAYQLYTLNPLGVPTTVLIPLY